jgi:hypothetical protein
VEETSHILSRVSLAGPLEWLFSSVDLPCINQHDLDKKNKQVSLMAFTYSRAKEVWVWLGHHRPPRWIEESNPAEWPAGWAIDHAEKYWGSTNYWIYGLIHPEYWKRTLIVQEIAMAVDTKVYFGRQSVSWSEWIELVKLYDRKVYDLTVGHVLKLEDLRVSKYADRQAFSRAGFSMRSVIPSRQ